MSEHRILKPEEFIAQYGAELKVFLTDLGHKHPKSFEMLTDLDLMSAPICPRCFERDGSVVQTSEPRRLCIPCSRDQEP